MDQSPLDKIAALRDQYSFYALGDVAIAAPYSEKEGLTVMHKRFYEDIAHSVERLGKSCFVPHRDLTESLKEENPIRVLMDIVVPSCDLLFYHHNMSSPGGPVNAMLAAANILSLTGRKRIKSVWFIEEELYEELHHPEELEVITFKNHQDGISKLTQAVRDFYKIN